MLHKRQDSHISRISSYGEETYIIGRGGEAKRKGRRVEENRQVNESKWRGERRGKKGL